MTKTINDVICPFCGTLCDDLEVVVNDDGKNLRGIHGLWSAKKEVKVA